MLADAVGTCLSIKGLNFDNLIASKSQKDDVYVIGIWWKLNNFGA